MYYIDIIPGTKDYFLLYNLETKSFTKEENTSQNLIKLYTLKDVYCFDLYKIQSFFGSSFPLMNDLQLLYGLQQKKCETIEELFDKEKATNYNKYKDKILAHIKSYQQCKIKVENYPLNKLINEEIYNNFYKERLSQISDILLRKDIVNETYEYYNSSDMISSFLTILSLAKNKIVYNNQAYNLKYNIFGSKNSRLTLRNKDFNLYNLSKEKRHLIEIEEDYIFAQLDYKSFQPRIALSLFGSEDVKKKIKNTADIYSLFEGKREDIKLELISWLFSDRKNEKFDNILADIRLVRHKMAVDANKYHSIKNIFGRPLFFQNEEENVIFQNYISSIESDVILRILTQVHLKLLHSQSTVFAPFYDCIIFKIHREEEEKISVLKEIMEQYLYKHFQTFFPVETKIGKNLSDLKGYNHETFLEAFSK